MVGNILAVGLMSLGMGMSGVKDEPQMYAQDESTYTITYENAEDWSSRADDIYAWLSENNYTYSSYLTITGKITVNNSEKQVVRMYTSSGNQIRVCNYSGGSVNNEYGYSLTDDKWYSYAQSPTEVTVTNLTITSQTYYQAMYEEPTMGEQIIPAIASGLGLIGALATEFLAGFGALFYSQGALTPFAIFSLVMLGVAVSFAVVKLVLALIRSNTGA